jgi:hypothetical protein
MLKSSRAGLGEEDGGHLDRWSPSQITACGYFSQFSLDYYAVSRACFLLVWNGCGCFSFAGPRD